MNPLERINKALEKELQFTKRECLRLQAEIKELKAGLTSIASNGCCDKCKEAKLVAERTLGVNQ